MVRILSDLHFRPSGSLIQNLRQIAPLLEGAERVVFNGDSVEMRFLEEREQAWANVETLRQLCRQAGAEPVFVTGNHDPVLSDMHHLELAGGAVFVTHGDILFQGLAPWSVEASQLRQAHLRETEALGYPTDLLHQLEAMRRAALSLEYMGGKFLRVQKSGALQSIRHYLWPPWRPWNILRGWTLTPFLANALVSAHAPDARFIILGHTHFSGAWRVGRRVVINTGGFVPLSRNLIVELDEEKVVVRRVVRENGDFRLGRQVTSYGLK